MFIQTESTPNPEVLKFLPGREVLGDGTREFRTADEAAASPLAQALFDLNGVERVFYGPDFLTVTKDAEGDIDWRQLKAPILAAIMEHFTSGAPLLAEGALMRLTCGARCFDAYRAHLWSARSMRMAAE